MLSCFGFGNWPMATKHRFVLTPFTTSAYTRK
jgi:hypothetical protein